jgi:hypothetical protein
VSPVCAAESAGRTAASWGDQLDLSGRVSGDLSALDEFAREIGARTEAAHKGNRPSFLPRRIDADQSTVEKDLAKLVLSLVDLVRRLMERQAVRRVNEGSLTDDEVERMGETFLKLDLRMAELLLAFGLEADDLNLNLGAIRD